MGLIDGLFKAAKVSKKVASMINEYSDTPDSFGMPDCPECGATMRYSYGREEFLCPECGYICDQNEIDLEDDGDSMPAGCAACGGPWPDCQSSCKMYDED